ncbi:MAG: hypothetical protein HY820_17280 [Acidobacteria bacterium]|nr:hypothetical protein [Acidobacteriota bacterium]
MKTRILLLLSFLSLGMPAQERLDTIGERHESWGRLPKMTGSYQGRQVQFRVLDGMALVEGDIILGRVEDLLHPLSEQEASRAAIALSSPASRWPGKTVVYQVDSAVPNQERITDAIKHWEENTSIRFQQRTDETGYVTFRRAASGCNSNIGYTGGAQTVNLADSCSTGNTIHEIGHTLGLYHTQSRADRDRNIRIRFENVDKSLWDQYDQFLTNTIDVGPYDYNSIMHYSATSDTRNFRNSIDTIPLGIALGQRTRLSTGDVHAVERIYGSTIEGVTITSIPLGAPVMVDGQRITTPRTFAWTAGEQHTISAFGRLSVSGSTTQRYDFAKWSDNGDQEHSVTVAAGTTFYSANYALAFQVRTGVATANTGAVTIIPESPDGFYPYGTLLRLEATPASAEQRFFAWGAGQGGATFLASNGQGNASNPVELTLRADGAFYVANFQPSTAPIVTITSQPVGAVVSVDNTGVYTPRNEIWAAGSSHTVSIASLQSLGGVRRFGFGQWSNDGPRTQTVAAPTAPTTITANLTERFEVLTDVNWLISRGSTAPTASRNITMNPTSPDGFYDTGTEIEFSATGPATAPFTHWYGDLAGPASTQKLTVSEQTFVTASFLSEPFVYRGGFVNAASQQPVPGSPGGLMILYRANVGPADEVTLSPGNDGKFPTTSNGVSVSFGTTAAQLLKLNKDSILLMVPDTVTGNSTSITVRAPTGNYTTTLPVATKGPGVFTVSANGVGQVYAINEDTSENSSSQPADRGTTIGFLVTGVGRVDEEGTPLLPLWAEIGGVLSEVVDAFPTEKPGIYGVIAKIDPSAASGPAVPVALFVNGTRSQYNATVAIR